MQYCSGPEGNGASWWRMVETSWCPCVVECMRWRVAGAPRQKCWALIDNNTRFASMWRCSCAPGSCPYSACRTWAALAAVPMWPCAHTRHRQTRPHHSGHQWGTGREADVFESTLARRAKFSRALVWPLELGLRTPTLRCGHLSGPSHTRGGFFDFEVGGHDGGLQGWGARDRPICWAKGWEVI